ncbi:protein vip1 [Aspergillus nomiae NRRL 13137]|uniref:Protein vip1 n=1 Tax=Aspergillus nomiae NRRL (strain ATCC 15546 / NRRL 13137 / CBS 260.88 / M93) TaxID=1509407 RepID=A0A0L1J2C7_ASPN3|nr:protein vip1 [Aspergillus nomiae NRRL 13137]KNG85897.1 protein vip1 [Aspergillus nomiae NRRL 13137]
MSERSTVHVSGIASNTSEKEVQDFFSFCGKITSISVTPVSGEPDAPKSATVTFEKEAAAKTALLLDQTQLGGSAVHVQAAQTLDDIAGSQAASAGEARDENHHEIAQEDKPKSRIFAEYLAHGYVLSDNAIQKAIALDQKHATDRARGIDESYKLSDKAATGWHGLHSYFEKALGTPSGQKLRDFYAQTDKQVRDIHTEARRLADLKSGKTTHEGEVPAAGGAEASGAVPAAAAPAAPAAPTAPAEPAPAVSQPAGTAAPAEPKA